MFVIWLNNLSFLIKFLKCYFGCLYSNRVIINVNKGNKQPQNVIAALFLYETYFSSGKLPHAVYCDMRKLVE